MVKEKDEKHKSCDECGIKLKDEDAFHHMGTNYCRECIQTHIKSERNFVEHDDTGDSFSDEAQKTRVTPEGKRAWSYKST